MKIQILAFFLQLSLLPQFSQAQFVQQYDQSQRTETMTDADVAHLSLGGITRYVGAHYQSCAPLLHHETPAKTAVSEHFDNMGEYQNAGQCIDRRGANTRYQVGGVLRGTDANAEFPNGHINALRRVWCSGAMAGTFSAAGMNFTQNQTDIDFSPTTSQIHDLSQEENSCLERPNISMENSLQVGDLLNTSYNHVVQIVRVGEDPLGLKSLSSSSECESLDQSRFDFTFVHSSRSRGQSGVHMQEGNEATTKSVRALVVAAKAFCRDHFSGSEPGRLNSMRHGSSYVDDNIASIFSHLRHVGNRKPGCLRTPPQVEGDACLSNGCYEEVARRFSPQGQNQVMTPRDDETVVEPTDAFVTF